MEKKAKLTYVCSNCSIAFRKLACQVKTATPCCSFSCAAIFRKSGNYNRTPEHKKKMSTIVSLLPHDKQRALFLKINKSRKGKTFKEIYGEEKAEKLLEFYSQRITGTKNFNYIDGRSFSPYPIAFNRSLKKMVKSLDGYLCVKCGLTENDAIANDTLNRGLTIHHIDFNKDNCSIQNLITLCKGCNSSANFHREETIIIYTQKVQERKPYASNI